MGLGTPLGAVGAVVVVVVVAVAGASTGANESGAALEIPRSGPTEVELSHRGERSKILE